jgi:hypothetical protein
MQVAETRCDYCTGRDGDFGQVELALVTEVNKPEVCQNCQARIAEFIRNNLMNRAALREMARRTKSVLEPVKPRSAP